MVESERVGSLLRRNGFEDPHARGVKDVNHSWRFNGDIDPLQRPIEGNNVGCDTKVSDQRDISGIQVDRHQLHLVTRRERLSRAGSMNQDMRFLYVTLE